MSSIEPIPLGVLPHGDVSPGIMASIEKALNDQIPEGKRGVLLQVRGTGGEAVAFGLAAKLDRGWVLAADVEKSWSGPVSGVISVARIW